MGTEGIKHFTKLTGKIMKNKKIPKVSKDWIGYKHLGSVIQNGKVHKKINESIGKTGKIFNMMKTKVLGKKKNQPKSNGSSKKVKKTDSNIEQWNVDINKYTQIETKHHEKQNKER